MQVQDLLGAVRRFRLDDRRIARAAGIDVAAVDAGRPIHGQAMVRLFEILERETGDARIGLHIAEGVEPSGPLAYLMVSCSTLEEAMTRCCRFGPALVTTMRISLHEDRDVFSLQYDFGDADIAACRAVAEYAMMSTAKTLWRAIGEDAAFLGVCFRFDDDGGKAEIERAFRCPALFGQPREALRIPRQVARRTPSMSNPLIADQIEKFAAALLPQEPAVLRSFREQVLDVTRSLLHSGRRAERRLVCRKLGVSERTLHRRLVEDGSSFRELRETVLWELAEALVSDGELKLEAVAESLGFSDAAAFSKAFKRRSGRSPAIWRRDFAATMRST